MLKVVQTTTRRISKNKRNIMNKSRVKFGIKVPNNVRDALIFDRENGKIMGRSNIKGNECP